MQVKYKQNNSRMCVICGMDNPFGLRAPFYVMEDDNPTTCSHYECSAQGDRERTEIYVVPQAEFPKWLLSEKSMPEEGVELLQHRP